jgi:hypothetical protein
MRKVRIMRTSAQIFLVVIFVLECTTSTLAQEALWEELNSEIAKLYQQGRYSEAGKVAEKALTVAEKTFGAEHPAVATSLNNLALLYDSRADMSRPSPFTNDHWQ